MKKMIFTLMFCIVAVGAYAQTPESQESLDATKVLMNFIMEEGAYDAMAANLAAMDFTLTSDEIAMLYYGFVFQPGYKGSFDQIMNPAVELNKAGEYERAWSAGVEYLKDNPVSLTALFELIKSGRMMGLPIEQIEPYLLRNKALLNVIASSGDGKSPETAFMIISVADEYLFMRIVLGAYDIKGQALIGECDKITVGGARNFDGTEIYFDATLPLMHGKKLFEK